MKYHIWLFTCCCLLSQLTHLFISKKKFRHIWASACDFQQCGICDLQSLRSACAYAQSDLRLCSSLGHSMIVKVLTEHHLEFLSLKGGCKGLSESTLVKMPHCWNLMSRFILFQVSHTFHHHCRMYLSHDMWFPTMWHFDKCRLRRTHAATF